MRRFLFEVSYYLKRPLVIKSYKEIIANENRGIDYLKKQQDTLLRSLIKFSVQFVPYYKGLFNQLGLTPRDIQCAKDLEKLPILTKKMIRNDPQSFLPTRNPKPYLANTTGGSTGVPLSYRMSEDSYARGVALQYRGWGFAGYRLGDKVSIIAGSSLGGAPQSFKEKVRQYLMNARHYSSFGMSEADFYYYFSHMQRWQPQFLRGYASSLYLLAHYMEEKNLRLNYHLKGIFSTSEVLTSGQRLVIEKNFDTRVFDNYGLNDGGVSAYECREHNGMHLDLERAFMETVDDDGKQVTNRLGRILATDLYNYAMPFIRYDTGDLGVISDGKCPCGCERPLLKGVYGRTTDYLKLNGKLIGSPILTLLMSKVDVEHYQIVQRSPNELDLKIVRGKNFSEKDEKYIINSLEKHVGVLKVNFVDVRLPAKNQLHKHKFIINEVCR